MKRCQDVRKVGKLNQDRVKKNGASCPLFTTCLHCQEKHTLTGQGGEKLRNFNASHAVSIASKKEISSDLVSAALGPMSVPMAVAGGTRSSG